MASAVLCYLGVLQYSESGFLLLLKFKIGQSSLFGDGLLIQHIQLLILVFHARLTEITGNWP